MRHSRGRKRKAMGLKNPSPSLPRVSWMAQPGLSGSPGFLRHSNRNQINLIVLKIDLGWQRRKPNGVAFFDWCVSLCPNLCIFVWPVSSITFCAYPITQPAWYGRSVDLSFQALLYQSSDEAFSPQVTTVRLRFTWKEWGEILPELRQALHPENAHIGGSGKNAFISQILSPGKYQHFLETFRNFFPTT